MNTKKLNALKERAHKTAIAHGFYEVVRPDAYYLGLVMSEMGEAINADRKGWHANSFLFENDENEGLSFAENYKKHIKDSVEDEIADIVIRLLDYAGLKDYTWQDEVVAGYIFDYDDALQKFEESGMPGMLFYLMDSLTTGLSWNELKISIYYLINIFFYDFGKMTGSDKGLWWFVERKMAYNEYRPKYNGKRY